MPKQYITSRTAELFKSSGKPTGMALMKGTVLTCDWLWDKAPLTGMRKIIEPLAYKDKFVKDIDLELYETEPPVDPPTEPPVEEYVTHHLNGEVRYFYPPEVTPYNG
jgi:hypothetical protein